MVADRYQPQNNCDSNLRVENLRCSSLNSLCLFIIVDLTNLDLTFTTASNLKISSILDALINLDFNLQAEHFSDILLQSFAYFDSRNQQRLDVEKTSGFCHLSQNCFGRKHSDVEFQSGKNSMKFCTNHYHVDYLNFD